jgi:hypothetical protein
MNDTELREAMHKRIVEEPGYLRSLVEGTMANIMPLFPDDDGDTLARRAIIMCAFPFKNREEMNENELMTACEEITIALQMGSN